MVLDGMVIGGHIDVNKNIEILRFPVKVSAYREGKS